jgi:hypothetical protein
MIMIRADALSRVKGFADILSLEMEPRRARVKDIFNPAQDMKLFVAACVLLCILVPRDCPAQSPVGTIAGLVRDPAGGVMSGVQVRAVNAANGQVRTTTTGGQGEYSVPALLSGMYELTAEAAGFQRTIRAAAVEAGTTTRADFILRLGEVSDSVTVEAASPQMQYESASVAGLITHEQIQGLPLNGRSFLELAKLEPGVQSPVAANRNRTVVEVLGAPATNVGGARFTVDGGSVTSVALGGAQMGFSQELVQEFQVSSVNFNLSAGMTDAGAINIVTRGGGNEAHATIFYFFRDHNLAADPALNRDQNNPTPFFQRRQFGLASGGPVRRDRVFYFGNWERNDQRAVATTTLLTPDFAHLSRTTASPLLGDLFSVRLDGKITDAHTVFVRHSRDASRLFGPGSAITGGMANAYPSNWSRVLVRAGQSVVGLTSVFGRTLVNDLRVSSFSIASSMNAARQEDCQDCLGLGAPSINIPQAGLLIGNSTANDFRGRRFHVNNSITWQGRAHRARFGIDWEHNRDRNLIWGNDPVSITLFSPGRVRAYNALPGISSEERISIPADFRTVEDILQLPLQNVTVGIGEPGVRQENGRFVRRWNTVWLYAEDTWRLHPRVTVTYGSGWGFDGNLNHDLHKPLLLAPILGLDALGPTRKNWTNFSPAAGIVWTASADGKTVFRAGAGRYYRPFGLTGTMDAERVALGPPGLGRQNFTGSSIQNPIRGIPGVPAGTPLDFRSSPTPFTGADLMAVLPGIRAGLANSLANADSKVQQIEISKQASPAIFPVEVPNPSAVHVNAGVQRELAQHVVLSADVVYRHFMDVPQNGGSIDVNRFNSIRGAAIPVCIGAQANDANALCSRGPINVQVVPYRFIQRGVLVRAEKRFFRGMQFLGSYAYSRNSATHAGNGFNLDNWLENRGPAGLRHTLNIAGVLLLPSQFELGMNFSYSSTAPFSTFVGGMDFNGDGTMDDLLPGTTVNAFNAGMDRGDLERFIGEFNQTYAGTTDARGTPIPRVALPAGFSFGDDIHGLDIRLSRSFLARRGFRVALIGEAFNVYNGSNLSGYSEDLTSAAFGKPTSRASQTFGSSGPRSFQLGMRVSF